MAASLTVVVPAYNEEPGITGTVRALLDGLSGLDLEVVVSDDGSTDATAAVVERLAVADPRVRLLRNPHKGRGRALKAGLAAATGDIVVTVDADLSYGPEDVRKIFEHLRKYPHLDLVIGSCYMPGGKVEGVPAKRLLISRWGNVLLRFAFQGRFWTTTGILRSYRREKLQALLPTLVSDGKELYLEFLHKTLAAGWSIEEIPATLTWRRGLVGRSAGLRSALGTHLGFVLARSSMLLWIGATCLLMLPLLFAVLYPAYLFDIPLLTPGYRWMKAHDALQSLVKTYLVMACVGIPLLMVAGGCRRIWRGRLGPPPRRETLLWRASWLAAAALIYIVFIDDSGAVWRHILRRMILNLPPSP